MNPTANQGAQVSSALANKQSGIIAIPENPGVDSVAAALSLYQGLTKLGKNVAVVCGTPVTAPLAGTDKIQQNLSTSGNNLVISLPYTDGSIDKVDYNIQGDHFNLIIAPKEGFPKLNSDQVKYSYVGGTFDFIVTVDVPSLKSLGTLYANNQRQFEGKTIINIDRRLTNAYFGTVNVVSKVSSSTSEIVLNILKGLQIEIDREIATALYSGLTQATNNFTSYSVNAGTFETAAYLLKLGAAKRAPQKPLTQPFGQRMPGAQRPQAPAYQGYSDAVEHEKIPTKPIPIQETARPQEEAQPQEPKPLEAVEKAPNQGKQDTPEDWLKPKIFKGGSNLI